MRKLELHRFKKRNRPNIERGLFPGKDLGVIRSSGRIDGDSSEVHVPGCSEGTSPRLLLCLAWPSLAAAAQPPSPSGKSSCGASGLGKAGIQEVSRLQSKQNTRNVGVCEGGAEKGKGSMRAPGTITSLEPFPRSVLPPPLPTQGLIHPAVALPGAGEGKVSHHPLPCRSASEQHAHLFLGSFCVAV